MLRYFTLDSTGHASHKEQASMTRRYIIWRNNHAYDERLRRVVDRGKRSLTRHTRYPRAGNPGEQMRTLRACKTCIEARTKSSGDVRHGAQDGRLGEVCPVCSQVMPLTGICDNCA
jgi:hypothetical protein